MANDLAEVPTESDIKETDSLIDSFMDGHPEAEKPEVKSDAVETPVAPVVPTEKPVEKPVTPPTAPATPPVVPPVTPQAPPVAPQPKDAELDAIQPPKGMSPKSQEGWKGLKDIAHRRGAENTVLKQEREQLNQQIEQLRQQPGDPKMREELDKLRADVSRYKALYKSEKDPEFQDKFDKQIQANEESVYKILEANGMDKENIEEIKKVGLDKVPDAFWQKEVLPNLTLVEKKRLEDAITNRVKLAEDRRASLDSVGENWQKFEEEQKAKTTQEYQKYTQDMGQHIQALTKDIPWARMQEIPATATPEQKAAIEKSNTFFKESEGRFNAALYPVNAQARVEVAAAACLSYKLQEDLEAAEGMVAAKDAEVSRLQAELDAIKGASVTSRKSSAPPQSAKTTISDKSGMSDLDAIEAGLNELGA